MLHKIWSSVVLKRSSTESPRMSYFARILFVKSHLNSTCGSFWIPPVVQEHVRFSCSILPQRPVSTFRLWEDKRYLVNSIRLNSAISSFLYTLCCCSNGFIFTYVARLVEVLDFSLSSSSRRDLSSSRMFDSSSSIV